ncbi:DMP19 family protein [Tenacibaculum finnmarkense]|uniref:DMP19 family protein n=1 Tax=Tenacibaculum finnmarkense TaxID=2781243 RepID=UPI001E6556A4|nr:DMP19 family protein [Tenacibaculum finnmarkense]MCD8445365.1 DMP19 family protein [Tenacibaculum finnmarkense genomovar ulcerans]
MKKDSYSGLSWMTEEIKNELIIRGKIVENEDIESLFSLKDNSDFSIALFEILQKRNEKEPNSLNEIELNLFLCMNLENAGQADSILSFLQEWFPEQNEKVIKSLNEIGASKSSEIIKKAIELLPENGTWFFESSNEESERIMSELDSEFSNYPDGPMRNLYRKYAEKNRNEL